VELGVLHGHVSLYRHQKQKIMGKALDLTGQRFERLLVMSEAEAIRKPSGSRVRRWNCLCDCGQHCIVRGELLRSKNTKSCGCLHLEKSRENGKKNAKHGMVGTPAYKSWAAMLSRCRHVDAPQNRHHGGKGVKVCNQWDPQKGGSFEAFFAHLGERPEGTTLDRYPNQEGNYEPGNVRWATIEEQMSNTSSNVFVEYQGVRMTLAQAARKSGIHNDTLCRRHKHGDRGEKLFRPTQHTGRRAWKSQENGQSFSGSNQAA
jgi:hypothetical protein